MVLSTGSSTSTSNMYSRDVMAFRMNLKAIVELLSRHHYEFQRKCQHIIDEASGKMLVDIDEDISVSIAVTPPIGSPRPHLPVTTPRTIAFTTHASKLDQEPNGVGSRTGHHDGKDDQQSSICDLSSHDPSRSRNLNLLGEGLLLDNPSEPPGMDLAKSQVVRSTNLNVSQIDELYARSFVVKQVWHKDESSQAQALSFGFSQNEEDSTDFGNLEILVESDFQYTQNVGACWSHVVASPGSQQRITWELVGMLLVLYDLISIPMVSCFSPPDSTFTDVMEWVSLLYWTVNVAVVLSTGFIQEGVLVLKASNILRNYLKTWFVVDVITLIPDWIFTLLEASGGTNNAGSYVKLLRVLRLVRLGRLARLVKLRNVWHLIADMIQTEKLGIAVDVIKMVCVLMLVNHYVACVWFIVGKTQTNDSWLKHWKFSSDHVGWFEQYVVSYHWSITQFTPSSMHVQPQSVEERVFAIVTIVFALVGFSYLVGSITGSLAKLRAMGEKKSNHFWLLRRFLLRNNVPKPLAFRIKAYAESAWDLRQSHAKPENVEVLGLLSDNLKAELAYAIHGQSLCIHPFFEQIQLDSVVTIRRLAFRGISQTSLAPADMMFYAGEAAEFMTIVTAGMLQYHRVAHGKVFSEIVEAGEDWIAEPVLWVDNWLHLGELEAQTATELLHVIPELFNQIIDFNPIAFKLAKHYAFGFVKLLSSCQPSRLSDITQGEDVSEQLWEMIGTFTKLSHRRSQQKVSLLRRSNDGTLTSSISGNIKNFRKNKGWRKSEILPGISGFNKPGKDFQAEGSFVNQAEARKRAYRETDGVLKKAWHNFTHRHFHVFHQDHHPRGMD